MTTTRNMDEQLTINVTDTIIEGKDMTQLFTALFQAMYATASKLDFQQFYIKLEQGYSLDEKKVPQGDVLKFNDKQITRKDGTTFKNIDLSTPTFVFLMKMMKKLNMDSIPQVMAKGYTEIQAAQLCFVKSATFVLNADLTTQIKDIVYFDPQTDIK